MVLMGTDAPRRIVRLNAVGYWRDADHPELPEPGDLAAPGWCAERMDRIAWYLRCGNPLPSSPRDSACRFRCGVPAEEIGNRDMTDGVWAWPEGLVHYVEKHEVRLPATLISGMRANRWRVPDVDCRDVEVKFDYDFWIDWSLEWRRPWWKRLWQDWGRRR